MTSRDELAARFEDLAATYGDRLMAYLLRRVDVEDAADVAAETLLTAWRRIRVMPDEQEEAFWWLLSIARRTAANCRRGIVRRTRLADRLRAMPLSVGTPPATDQHIVLRHAITTLSDDDQELVRLVYWDDLQIKAAATVLGVGEATARKRMQRARESLRSALAEEEDPVSQLI